MNNDLLQLGYVISFTVTFLPFCKNIIIFLPNNYKFKNYLIISLSQYTNWNLFIILLYYNFYYNNILLIKFILINSFVINTIYHIFYIYDRNQIMTLPNIPKFINQYHIFILSFFVHVMPFLIFYNKLLEIQKNNIIEEKQNIGYLTSVYNLLWAYMCFGKLDPTSVYLKVSDKYIVITWITCILLHISYGKYIS